MDVNILLPHHLNGLLLCVRRGGPLSILHSVSLMRCGAVETLYAQCLKIHKSSSLVLSAVIFGRIIFRDFGLDLAQQQSCKVVVWLHKCYKQHSR